MELLETVDRVCGGNPATELSAERPEVVTWPGRLGEPNRSTLRCQA